MMYKFQNALFKALESDPDWKSPEKLKAKQELLDRIRAAEKERGQRIRKLLDRGGELGDKMGENLDKTIKDNEKIKP